MAIATAAWALVVPPFQVPDEGGNFGYVQSLVEDGRRPVKQLPDGRRPFSYEEQVAEDRSRGVLGLGDPSVKPPWSEAVEQRWESLTVPATRGEARENVRTVGPQSDDPPLYYAYEAIPYAAGSGGGFFDRLYLMRLWSGLLMLVTTAGAWLLIGELTGRDRLLQLAGAACVGLQPMATFVSGGVNADAGLLALWSIELWLGVRVLSRGPSRATVSALVATAVAACLVKTTALVMIPPLGLVLLLAARRAGRPHRLGRLHVAAGAAACAAAAVVAVAASRDLADRILLDAGPGDLRAFASYLWQYYLPALPGQQHFTGIDGGQGWNLWVETAWGAFGWMEVRLPDALYAALAALAVLTFAAAARALARRTVAATRAALAFLAASGACLVAGVHWAEFSQLADGSGPTAQGRYLLPLLPIAGAAVAAALTNLEPRRRPAAVALTLGGMVALQVVSLAATAGRFYA
ncbi:MAG TPA: DUF2142 domain-containing protein [Thermoleophilaceae bacterium]